MNNKKNDKLVSVGILISEDLEINKIENLYKLIKKNFTFFEIVIVTTKFVSKKLLNFSISKKNTRILEINNDVSNETFHSIVVDNSIGDYCCILDLSRDPIDDLLCMLENQLTMML